MPRFTFETHFSVRLVTFVPRHLLAQRLRGRLVSPCPNAREPLRKGPAAHFCAAKDAKHAATTEAWDATFRASQKGSDMRFATAVWRTP